MKSGWYRKVTTTMSKDREQEPPAHASTIASSVMVSARVSAVSKHSTIITTVMVTIIIRLIRMLCIGTARKA